ncbi:undecaprenyldiphospho-muramoylpentapeptide beta-N-acetylglucosaminyltransferase [Sphingobacteriaceae bacterium WQ 2009]|uniref:UDP-N-acetylglucosamine--N-acetylmuramyl-(pentapeptide) pyrophosphoryl-undecaprenol N-acetylglucosamine transferase n=1 Tax=Rhinopithecimicrobium faecis TaxID=2820698 RepID=A0A8T4H9Y6_9SPHI|nr:undecaprenyldiphospho-muramoylpentapeptide beta-N-acetylglucosaminyltransferase [Sphingobacteriaceae bacterium WQ 2009]
MARRVIISGGGTGGHIFPAVAIANALKELAPDTEILFVGANGKMEMEKVPAAGYKIVGLDIQGINRQSLWKNIFLPVKLVKSLLKAKSVIKSFQPQVAVGVGGYASGPLLMMAGKLGIPTLIQEQNSYAGVTNKKLGVKAAQICVAFEGMEQFFPADKITLTGNPIRRPSVAIEGKREEALASFGFDSTKRTVLITGGSLGARTLNRCLQAGLDKLIAANIQVIWQCGSYYYESLNGSLNLPTSIQLMPFIQRMDYAYAAADLIIARAGAGTISELCVVGKPVIMVPSPNVAEDHQTKNAQSLVQKDAAVLIADSEAEDLLIDALLALLSDADRMTSLGQEIKKLARLDADRVIAQQVLDLADKK